MSNGGINPWWVLGGYVFVPAVLTPVGVLASGALSNDEFRNVRRNLMIYNGLLTVALGYASTSKDLDETWRSISLGGAIGTGLNTLLLAILPVPIPAEELPPGVAPLVAAPSAPLTFNQANPAGPAALAEGVKSWFSTPAPGTLSATTRR